MAENFAVILADDGTVENVIVVPENDADLGPAWQRDDAPKLRRLSEEDRDRGVGIGWKRSSNGRFVDERPTPPAPNDPPAPRKAASRGR